MDADTAFANAVNLDISYKILLIGRGETCQIYQRTYAEKMFEVMGISMPPDSAFKIRRKDNDWFYTDCMDTKDSESLLNYQKKSFENYVEKLRNLYSKRRTFAHLISSLIEYILLGKSPYYKT